MMIEKTIFILIISIFISNCASNMNTINTYEGKELPSSQVAIIQGMHPYDPLDLYIATLVKKVDGKKVSNMGFKVAVLPGTRKIEIYCGNPAIVLGTTKTIESVFVAGHVYTVSVSEKNEKCKLSVFDNTE